MEDLCITSDVAYLYGAVLMGDGKVQGNTISFGSTDIDFQVQVMGALIRWTGFPRARSSEPDDTPDRVHTKEDITRVGTQFYKLWVRSRPHAQFLLNIDPHVWMKECERHQILLVRGFADANGSVGNYEVKMVDTDPKWVTLVAALLCNLGVEAEVTKYQSSSHPDWKTAYYVIIRHRWPLTRYMRRVNFSIRRKKAKLLEQVERYQRSGRKHFRIKRPPQQSHDMSSGDDDLLV